MDDLKSGALDRVARDGFFAGAKTADPPPLREQADLLGYVLSRSLGTGEPPSSGPWPASRPGGSTASAP